MKMKIAKHYEETWAEKESEYKEKIEKQEVRSRATARERGRAFAHPVARLGRS